MSDTRAERRTPAQADRLWRIAFAIAAAALAATGFWLFCGHMREGAITSDWPWLYRAGQSIWLSGIPHHDTLSWTFPHRHWVLYQWLFEAVAAPVYDLLGPDRSVLALCLLGGLMYAVWPARYFARRGVNPWLTLAIGGLVLIPVSVNFGLRPMIASNLALLAQWVIIERLREARLRFLPAAGLIGVVYVLWANSHLGFTLGLASLALFFLADLIEHTRTPERHASWLGVLLCYAGLGSVAVLATGCNPYGWTLFHYIWHLSNESAMNAHIHELMPAHLSNSYMAAGFALLVIYLLFVLADRRHIRWAGLLHVLLFAVGTADAVRFVIWAGLFYSLAAPPVVASVLSRSAPRLARILEPPSRARVSVWLPAAIAAVAIFSLGSAYTSGRVRIAGCVRLVPAIHYLDTHLPRGAHWFSSERVGSCTHLIAPRRKVLVDTRFDMYPESFVLNWFRAYQYRYHWKRFFARWKIRYALLDDNAPLTPRLLHDKAFSHRDVGNGLILFTQRAGRGVTPADTAIKPAAATHAGSPTR